MSQTEAESNPMAAIWRIEHPDTDIGGRRWNAMPWNAEHDQHHPDWTEPLRPEMPAPTRVTALNCSRIKCEAIQNKVELSHAAHVFVSL